MHTPDGAPCGLLNHLTHVCRVTTDQPDTSALPALLATLGMTPALPHARYPAKSVVVMLDGRVLGRLPAARAPDVAAQLRRFKVLGLHGVPAELEIACVPVTETGAFPGLILFSSPARMMRPTVHASLNAPELIGSFEQAYLDIAVLRHEAVAGRTTHVEEAPTHMLSVIANITPFCDFNQSPRNMYQCQVRGWGAPARPQGGTTKRRRSRRCAASVPASGGRTRQMGKQSMGTPTHSFPYRTDNKMYRLLFPQTPIVRPSLYQHYGFDNYPNGMNAIVAVIAYTGTAPPRRDRWQRAPGARLTCGHAGGAASVHRRVRHGGRDDPEQVVL